MLSLNHSPYNGLTLCLGSFSSNPKADANTSRRSGVRPGYGLYDRALGIQYLLGVWDAVRYRPV